MEPADTSKWIKAGELLEQVLTRPEGEQAAAAEELGSPAGVLAELRTLLESTRRSSVLDEPLARIFDDISPAMAARDVLRGRQFGGWLLEGEIGRGGMSVVYRATRSGDGFEQHAAFKLLSVGFLHEAHIQGFLRERKILSELTHPGIARLIDGGVTPDGTPYLVMEHIEGQRIDTFCEQQAADVQAVVKLVIQVGRAAAHAHRHLVVHRDINPANVLVDRLGNTVLLDFGIAKLLGEAETGCTLQAFTPDYAAPEQRQGGVITTATDVYGLGKLLARLLSGHKTDSELRSIVYVATHQDADRRYATAREMADDLQTWLEHRPVMARPDSLVYRTRKFTRRNWQWLSVAGLAVVVSITGLLSTQKQAEMRRLEADRHRVVADFMLGLFQQADLMQSGSDLRVTDLLEQAARQAREELLSEPEILVSLLSLIASGQTELMNYPATAELLGHAEELIARHGVSASTEADYYLQRAKESHELGRLTDAVKQAGTAVTLLAGAEDAGQSYYQAAAAQIAYMVDAEQYDAALELAENLAREISQSPAGLEARVDVAHNYAIALEVSGKIDAAYQQYERALGLQREYQPQNELSRAAILSDYGISLYFDGRHEQAEDVHREVLEIYRHQFKPPHPRISSALHNLAFSLIGQSRLQEAVGLLQQAYQMSVELHGAEHIDTLLEQATLGNLLMRLEQFDAAESLFRDNLAVLERVAPDMRVQRGAVHSYLGDVLLRTNRLPEARVEYLAAREFFAQLPEDNVRVIETRARLAEISGRMANAQP